MLRDIRFLELLRDTAHGITQYIASAENPLWDYNGRPLPFGYVNERINMSDWESKACVGGVFSGSTWAEVACLLTCTEIPGIYIDSVRNRCMVFDHVEADMTEGFLKVFNPTEHDLLLRIVEDDGKEMRARCVSLRAKERIDLER